jgi:outer membrane lipoprotein carrier protein
MRIRLLLVVALFLPVASVTAGRQTVRTESPQEVAARLQRKYDSVKDFSADFVHQHEGGVLRRKLVERGTVFVKKPGRMRWHYKAPEEKYFVSDGAQLYFYDPQNNQVTISAVPQDDQAATAVLFLTGKGNLTRDFRVTFAEGGPAGAQALHLEPTHPQAEYDWLELVADAQTLQIRTLVAADRQGGRSTFQFSNFKENVGLTDKTFAFTIPRGAEVIHAGRAKR